MVVSLFYRGRQVSEGLPVFVSLGEGLGREVNEGRGPRISGMEITKDYQRLPNVTKDYLRDSCELANQ